MKQPVSKRSGKNDELKLKKKAAELAKKASALLREQNAFEKEIERIAIKRGSKSKEVKVRHKKWGEGPYSPCPKSMPHASGHFICFLIKDTPQQGSIPRICRYKCIPIIKVPNPDGPPGPD